MRALAHLLHAATALVESLAELLHQHRHPPQPADFAPGWWDAGPRNFDDEEEP